MRYSFVTALLLATSAMATPQLVKRGGEPDTCAATTTTVTKTVYVKATAAPNPNHNGGYPHNGGNNGQKKKKTKTVTATVTSTRPCDGEQTESPEQPTIVVPPPPAYTPVQPPKYEPPTYEPAPEPKAPEPTDSYTPPTGDSLADKCTRAHNKHREEAGAPPLQWDDEIAAHCNRSDYECQFDHMKPSPYGENLAQGYSDVEAAIQGWADEKSQYRKGMGFSMATGHYTQLVWKKTTRFGCALQKCGGRPILRCQYNPPGNYAGAYDQNV